MNKKPIDVLNEQINVYKKFIASVESEDNHLEFSKEQIEIIICETRLKITEFEDAVKILSEETRK